MFFCIIPDLIEVPSHVVLAEWMSLMFCFVPRRPLFVVDALSPFSLF